MKSEPLRGAKHRRSREAARHQILLEGITFGIGKRNTGQMPIQLVGQVLRVIVIELRRAQRLHIARDPIQGDAGAHDGRDADDDRLQRVRLGFGDRGIEGSRRS
jgi:hypothetical protein